MPPDPPSGRSFHSILAILVKRARRAGGRFEEMVLDSGRRRDRWAADTFPNLFDEFRYKTLWVVHVLRARMGRLSHGCFDILRYASVPGLLAGGWLVRGTAAYVCLRQVLRPATRRRRPVRYEIVLGAMRPTPPPWRGPEGDEARAAAGVALRIH